MMMDFDWMLYQQQVIDFYQMLFDSTLVVKLTMSLILLVLSTSWFFIFVIHSTLTRILLLLLSQIGAVALSHYMGNVWLVYPSVMLFPPLIVGLLLRLMPLNWSTENETTVKFGSNKGNLYIDISKHVGIFGSTGSGKTESGFVPIIVHIFKYGLSSLVFDYKDWELWEKVLGLHEKARQSRESNRGGKEKNQYPLPELKCLYFNDPNYSDHFNPISPRFIEKMEDVEALASEFFNNLYPGDSEGNFFKESGAAAFAGVIWYMKENEPEKCTFPHVCALMITASSEDLIKLITQSDIATVLAAPFVDARDNERQLASVKSSVSAAIKKVCTPSMFMVMSKDEIDLDINNPDHPTILGLINVPQYDAVYLPVIALTSRLVMNKISQRNRRPTVIIFDEGSALKFKNLDRVLATLRTFKVLIVWGLQDKVQGAIMYGELVLKAILTNLSVTFFGKANDPDTAMFYGRLFETKMVSQKSKTYRDADVTTSVSQREEKKYKDIEFRRRKPGQFFIIDSFGRDSNVRLDEVSYEPTPAEIKHQYSEVEITDNFHRIFAEVRELVADHSTSVEVGEKQVAPQDDPFGLKDDE